MPEIAGAKPDHSNVRPPVVQVASPGDAARARAELIVKFKSDGPHELTECAETVFAARDSFRSATADGSDSLDRLMSESGVRRARALIPGRVGLSTAVAKARLQSQFRAVAARFQQRSARLSRSALQPRPAVDLTNLYVLEVPAGTDLDALSKRYAADPHVEYAQPNYLVKAVFTPNDPYYSSTGSWGQFVDDLWGLKKIGMATAWDTARGLGQTVAVVDSGVDIAHPDIQPNIWVNSDEIAGNGLDDDNNGLIDDRNGWDYVSFDSNPTDDMGHGTHVAGIIGAVGNNGQGISGVAPQAKVMPLKALDANGEGQLGNLVNAIRYAADNGADVINNSWGCAVKCPSSPAVEDVVAYAYGLGATVVFAAGNTAEDIVDFSPQNRPEPIVVGATDPNEFQMFFTNVGLVDVTAPGGGVSSSPPAYEPFRNVLSLKSSVCNTALLCPPELVVGTQYLRQAGTSMAAPFVSGVAALILQQHPTYSPEQVRQVLRKSAFDTHLAGFDPVTGYGRVAADAALAQPVPLQAVISSPVNPTLTAVTSQAVRGTASGTGFANYRVEVGAGLMPFSWTTIANATTAVNNGQLANWNPSAAAEGIHTLRVVATTTDGRTYEDRQRVFVDNLVITEPASTILSHPSPLAFRTAGTPIAINGTVSPANFSSYAVNIRRSDGTLLSGANVTLANGGSQRVVNGSLATWNTTGVAADNYLIEVVATLTNGTTVSESTHVIVDPSLHAGFPQGLGFIGSIQGGFIVAYAVSDHLIATDVNGNGAADLLVGYGANLRIFDHTGAQLPGWPQTVDPSNQGAMVFKSPAVGDVTGDASPEIVATNTLGQVFVWRSNGTLLSGFPLSLGAFQMAPAIADLTNNGSNEIVLTSWGNGWVHVINSAGTAQTGWPLQVTPSSAGLSPPAIGDLDNDGQKEVVVIDAVPPANVYVYSPTGQLKAGWPKAGMLGQGTGHPLLTAPVLGDLDSDGDLEIVIAAHDGTVAAFHHTGTSVSGWPRVGTGPAANSATLGNIDGVAGLEVIAGYNGVNPNTLFAWRGNGSLLSGWPVSRAVWAAGGGFSSGALADLDSDGRADVISSNDVTEDPLRTLHAFRFDGTSVAGFPKFTAYSAPLPSNSAAIANMDSDPQLEVAWIDLFANLYIWDTTAPATGPQPWPMFQQNPRLTGQAPMACTAETNAAFCTRLGKNCGSVTGTDNCGAARTVSSCGSCTAPQTCGGGGTANVCGVACTPETNAQFCTRLGKNCGSVTGTDNCGASRTVSSCGSCTSPQTCGGGGTANVCGGGAATACTSLCTNPTQFAGPSYQSGNLGTNATCHQTAANLTGAVCGNFASGRTFRVNNVLVTCSGGNITLPAKRNGGYCFQASAGNHAWAYFSTW